MNIKQAIQTSLFAALLALSFAARADDIDIYAGLGVGANAPNLIFVIDSSANSDASFGNCFYDQSKLGDQLGGTPSNGSKTLGNEQCALVNLVKFMPTRPVTDPTTGVVSYLALMKLGITTSDGLYFPLVPIDDHAYTGPTTITLAGTTVTISAGSTNRQAFVQAAQALYKHTGNVDQGDMMQETWAYYTGGDGTNTKGLNVNTGIGMISGKLFSGTTATSGCQKNYVVFLGATSSSSHMNDSGNVYGELTDAVTLYENSLVPGSLTQTQANANITTLTSVILNGLQPDKYTPSPTNPNQGSFAREWARFMYQEDVNSANTGLQNITTYSVSVGGSNVDMANFINDMANFGGGKYYSVSTYADLYNALLKILNEVQAVNSVFSSSSLPVSVNAQGTYLNQIYMGMFRPDAQSNPRWVGNLKQYQFVYDTTTRTLHLGDALGNLAISSAGTGFISPNAISFWTCTNLTSPYADPYVTNSLTSAQITLLQANNQSCIDPPNGNGFWASDPTAATAIAQGFDLPDGERVERGGSGQQIRHANLNDDYTQAAGSATNPRNLYTYCPQGTGCVAALTDVTNVFAPSNTGITAAMFGAAMTVNITSIQRNATGTSGTTATVTTASYHGFNSGDLITIANASNSVYNGTFAITVVDSTHFTYTVPELPPNPIASTSSYTASVTGTGVSISTITRSGNTVTVTTSTAHGLPSGGGNVVISGVTPAAYNGTFPYTYINTTQFSYTLNEQPPTAAGTGTIAPVAQAVASGFSDATCGTAVSVNINLWNATAPGVSRALGSTIATVNTTASIPFKSAAGSFKCPITISNVVDANGLPVAAYNGTFSNAVTALTGTNSFSISGLVLSPVSPGSGGTAALASGAAISSSGLSYTDIAGTTTATATATTATAHGFFVGEVVSIGGTGPATEAAYLGSVTITAVPSTTTFQYVINTTPASPATALTGATMTATRNTGFSATDMTTLINWVRGQDNMGDEASLCPGGVAKGSTGAVPGANYTNCPTPVVTVRPSVHGDVLHSRPTVVNYGSYPVAILSTSDSGTTRTATASTADVATIKGSGATPVVTFANLQMCPVTVTSTTTFTYSTTNCGNSGPQTAQVGSKVVVFYGDNGGVFHAVNGNQTMNGYGVGPGDEMWGFIPSETFLKLARQRANSPELQLPSTPPGILPQPQFKDYFVDGATGIYQVIDGNGNTTRAVLYLALRRGGNVIYALDVTNPANPTVLWRVSSNSAGMSELGQTWSQPKVAWVRGYSSSIDPQTGKPVPVVIFGGGYDTNEDTEPLSAADAHGRAIFALDALTGALVWKATTSSGATTACGGGTHGTNCLVNGMDYAIPADITLVDRNSDGNIDRLYAADLGGNIWRVDLEPGCNNTYPCTSAGPTYWNVTQLAALGCLTGACPNPSNPTQRKFFYPPEVIFKTSTDNYDAVVDGSGDREHPLYVSASTQRFNRLFLIKDYAIGDNASTNNVISLNGTFPLFDATTTPWDGSLNGYYITLAPGEKGVNAPLAVAGLVYISTNTPPAPNSNSCTATLGTAIGYQLSPFAGTYKTVIFDGGGLPPSPVAGVVNIVVGDQVKQVPFIIGGANPNCVGPDCKSALGGQKPVINVPTTRHRTYRYIKGK